ncbi:uncharacterized protein LOC117119103 isoform X1 [Anneissia japonica]|uniref:uncharacterized protein LOC117119103 isoform X1 n=1 Tax=Anneissia japonica TaxID=1529436 RepID=UPI001425B899|nr:uncharacterized protein LOC117119103 isoform X1 [Anneissia japonica]
MELTMTRLLLLTIVGAILSVSKVSSNPAWATRANKRSELKEALEFLKKHLRENEEAFATGSRRMETDGFPSRQTGKFGQVVDTRPMYDQRFNFGKQRETPKIEPVEMFMNEQMASDDELSFAIPEEADLDDSLSSEGEFVEGVIADFIAKEILDEIQLDKRPAKDDKPLNTIEDSYVGILDESPVVSFDSAEENENYERFLARTENQEEKPLDTNLPDNEFDQDLLDELMMTYFADNGGGQETANIPLTNENQEESVNEPILTEEERILAETILHEIEEELEREKIRQAESEKMKKPTAPPPDTAASCPILGFLVDDCEIATIDGIDGDGYKQEFRQPCNWHQICYTCGAGYGISQDICDEAFYLEMLSRCDNSPTCVDRADFFLLAVTEDRIPIRNSPSVCQRKCLKDFLLGLDG